MTGERTARAALSASGATIEVAMADEKIPIEDWIPEIPIDYAALDDDVVVGYEDDEDEESGADANAS